MDRSAPPVDLRRAPRAALLAAAVLAIGVLVAASALVALAPGEPGFGARRASVEMHTNAGAPAAPGLGALAGASPDGALALAASRSALAFGDVAPGESSAPVDVDVTNTGALPFRLSFTASPLRGPDGAEIPGSAIEVAIRGARLALPDGAPARLEGVELAPGATLTIAFTLHAPSAVKQHVPAGSYAGSLEIAGVGA